MNGQRRCNTHTHTRILISYKKCNSAICSDVNVPREYAQWNKSEKDNLWYHLYVEPKNKTNGYIHFSCPTLCDPTDYSTPGFPGYIHSKIETDLQI